MRKIDMFKIEGEYCGRTHTYDFAYQAEYDKKVLEDLLDGLDSPKTLCYTGLDVLDYSDENHIGNDSIRWLYHMKCKETNTEKDIRECIRRCSTENEEWTKWRNRNLRGIFYREITFLPEIQEMMGRKYREYINLLDDVIDELRTQEKQKSDDREKRRNQWKRVRVYKKIMPSGGENGRDGYIDADYESADGTIIRMVLRDVFDFGIYSYPKRLEGTEDALNNSATTEEENKLQKWLCEFGDFKGIRM